MGVSRYPYPSEPRQCATCRGILRDDQKLLCSYCKVVEDLALKVMIALEGRKTVVKNKGPNKNTNLYKFSHDESIVEYGEFAGLSGPWWDDQEEWANGFKPWYTHHYGG